jgi:hypothetical protein
MSPAERSLEELFREAPITSFLNQELARCDSGVAEVELRHRRESSRASG